jgi:CRP-like cAMP-binding protein
LIHEILHKVKERFPYLEDDRLEALLRMGEMRALEEGQVFIAAGERTHSFAIVIQGMVRNYVTNENGEDVTVVFATQLQAIAPYTNIFLNRPASETCAAVEQSMLFVLDFRDFKKLAEEDSVYMRLYADVLQEALVNAIERIEDFTKEGPEKRYQDLLNKHGFLIERVPLKYLASYLGITPVSLSRIRKRLSSHRN